jgi:hypothetical protein
MVCLAYTPLNANRYDFLIIKLNIFIKNLLNDFHNLL